MSREEIYDTTLGNETRPLRFMSRAKSSRMNYILGLAVALAEDRLDFESLKLETISVETILASSIFPAWPNRPNFNF